MFAPTKILLALFLGLVVVAGSGCISAPRMSADVVGMGDLAQQTPEFDPVSMPDALALPRLAHRADTPDGTRVVARPPYRIGPLDQITVVVWGRPDLGSQVVVGFDGDLRASTVRTDGTIGLPFIGSLHVGGGTIEEIRALIEARYGEIIENPQVEVSLHVCASQSVQLGGAMTLPGTYFLCDTTRTVGEMFTVAQGLALTAHVARGMLTRAGTSYVLDYREGERGLTAVSDIILEDGDRIYFPSLEDRFVYVFGEVEIQGVYTIPREGMTVLNAIGMAQGPRIESFKSGGVFLMRRVEGEVIAYQITFADLLQGPDLQVADGDRVFVATSGLQRWARWWEQALPFLRVNLVATDLLGRD